MGKSSHVRVCNTRVAMRCSLHCYDTAICIAYWCMHLSLRDQRAATEPPFLLRHSEHRFTHQVEEAPEGGVAQVDAQDSESRTSLKAKFCRKAERRLNPSCLSLNAFPRRSSRLQLRKFLRIPSLSFGSLAKQFPEIVSFFENGIPFIESCGSAQSDVLPTEF